MTTRIPDTYWRIAEDIFSKDPLTRAAVALEVGESVPQVLINGNVGDATFRKSVFEFAAARKVESGAFIANIEYKFAALPDGTRPFPDFRALTVVFARPDGMRLVESRRIYLINGCTEFGESLSAHMPDAVLIDEVLALSATVH